MKAHIHQKPTVFDVGLLPNLRSSHDHTKEHRWLRAVVSEKPAQCQSIN